ncbi:hypothetical protein ACPEEZ_01785 [Frigoribacterium sp. 2-23]|uniref:FliH/SctL family protein n=1 Tax=Frigoribacterium sp. 2-23 TaxID=3415006 RepID=UPI003C6FB48C
MLESVLAAPDGATAAPADAPASAPADFTRVVYPSLTRSGAAVPPHSSTPSSTGAEPSVRAVADARAEARGHAAGYAAGLRQADAELAVRRASLEADFAARAAGLEEATRASIAALDSAARALQARVAPVLAEAEEALVAVAVELAESVLGYELAMSAASVGSPNDVTRPVHVSPGHAPDATPRSEAGPDEAGAEEARAAGRTARAALARALRGADAQIVATVRLHPADLAQLSPEIVATVGVPLVADAGLARGDAEADLPNGIVDARLDTAFARARAALLDDAALATSAASTAGSGSGSGSALGPRA